MYSMDGYILSLTFELRALQFLHIKICDLLISLIKPYPSDMYELYVSSCIVERIFAEKKDLEKKRVAKHSDL